MNCTQEQIKTKAHQALKDLNDHYFHEEMIDNIIFDQNGDFRVNETLYKSSQMACLHKDRI